MPAQTNSPMFILATSFAILLATALTPRSSADEGPASLVDDLARAPDLAAGLDPQWLTVLGDELFFSGRSALAGRELWTSDGTEEGTRMVADVCSGSCSGVSGPIVPLADAVYFEACDAVPTCQLWESDGTSEGTFPVTRLSRSGSHVKHLTEWKGALYFEACDVAHGCELWESDGTPAGTRLLADVAPGPADAEINRFSVVTGLTAAAGRLFFTASGDRELWATDGTTAGTRRLSLFPTSMVTYQGIFGTATHAFFVVDFFELWTSDGTVAGTRLVLDHHLVDPLTVVSDRLYFSSLGDDQDRELWVSDGTASGTRLVKAGFGPMPFPGVAFRGQLYFGVGFFMWRSDGTPEGTVPVADLDDVIVDAAVTEETLFAGTRSALWKIDGAGASLVTDAYSAAWLEPFGGGVAFAAESGDTGSELAVSPGLGASLLTDVAEAGSSYPGGLTAHRGTLLFSAFDDPAELYQSRGADPRVRPLGSFELRPLVVSAGGTAFVMGDDLWKVEHGGELAMLLEGEQFGSIGRHSLLRDTAVAFKGRLAFLVWNFATDHIELWASDGTPEGTRRLDELMEFHFCFICDPPMPLPKSGAVTVRNRLYAHFAGRLWATDGGEGHAVDLGGDCGGCEIGPAAAVGNRLFYSTSGYDQPRRLWVSDGTAAGTRLVRQLGAANAGPQPVRASDFRGLGRKLYFVYEDPKLGEELWRSNGTAKGTAAVRDIRRGRGSSNPRDLAVLGGRLYFSADDGVRGRELWTSDGTARGTRIVADLRPGAAGSQPAGMAAIDGRLYFSAADGVHGSEPWTSDGSARGTRMLQDLEPGPLPSSPGSFTASGSRIYFSAGTTAEGFELWSLPRDPR